jgi:hypothetical protein
VLLFSSRPTFDRVLDDPEGELDGGDVWVDHIHPTTGVYDVFARDLVKFLESVDINDDGKE